MALLIAGWDDFAVTPILGLNLRLSSFDDFYVRI